MFYFCFFFNSQSIDSGFFLTLFLLSSAFTQFGLISLSTSLLSLYHCLCHLLRISVEGRVCLSCTSVGKEKLIIKP